MKKYIGTKQIEAEPMTMGEAYEKGLLQAGRVPNENEKNNAGYHVKYQDGYESWSPAEPFEKAYKCAETFLDRLIIEHGELVERCNKLNEFIMTDKFETIVTDPIQRELLREQYDLMLRYQTVLSKRIQSL
jgi:hypothetical protein